MYNDIRAALYLIEILHQTTTATPRLFEFKGCILSKFYIKPQLVSSIVAALAGCILSKFYIKPQPPGGFLPWEFCCILSKFYIKPQQRIRHKIGHSVVSYRNSTSNHNLSQEFVNCWRVVSYRNSTSNHNILTLRSASIIVVSYRNSTSNHNAGPAALRPAYVVSYRNSTSNHNISTLRSVSIMLYLIEILHQTTTFTTSHRSTKCCILSKFYIKPQPFARVRELLKVVSYRNSTSNHNLLCLLPLALRCILSKFYIKPQLIRH